MSAWLDVDFREIPESNKGGDGQNAFELFAQDLLEAKGFKIIEPAGRGPDKGKDLVVSEVRSGIIGSEEVRILVSCKHFAHSASSRSVGNSDELNMTERLMAKQCRKFLGFYSTINSQTLDETFRESSKNFPTAGYEAVWINKSKIVSWLQENEKTLNVFKKHLRRSFERYLANETESGIYLRRPVFRCVSCNCDTLISMDGILIRGYKMEPYVSDESKMTSRLKLCKISCAECAPKVVREMNLEMERYVGLSGGYNSVHQYKLIDLLAPKRFMNLLIRDFKHANFTYDYIDLEAFRFMRRFYEGMFYFVARKQEGNDQNENTMAKLHREFSENFDL